MPILAKAGGERNPVSIGAHIGICVRIIDLGTQHSERFGTKQKKVMIVWEIPDETIIVDGKEMPKLISEEYTLSLGERANLRGTLEAWRGKQFTNEELEGFDLRNVLGHACQLQVIHKENGYAKVNSVMSMLKNMERPKQIHPSIYFDLSDPSCVEMINELPEWIQKKIWLSPEYREIAKLPELPSNDYYENVSRGNDDDLPF